MVGVAKYDYWQDSGKGKDLQCCVHGRPCPFAQPLESEVSDSEKDRQQTKAANGYDDVALPVERHRHSSKRSANIAKNLSKKSRKHLSRKASKRRERSDRSIRASGSFVKEQKRYSQKDEVILGHEVGRHSVKRSSYPKRLQASSSFKESVQGNARAERKRCAHCHCEYDTNSQRYKLIPMSKTNELLKPKHRDDPCSPTGLSPPRSCGSNVRTAKCPAMKTSSLCNVYMGVLTQREAEDSLIEPTSFKLYHKLPVIRSLGQIPPKLPLMVVYRSDKGMHYHYGIKERRRFVENADNPGQVLPITSFQVDYGDTQAPIFTSIRSLVHYYTVYSQLRRTNGGGNVVDMFPRWHRCKRIVGDEDE
uniref:Uncharacterized protein n=3 Tax=Parascaris univalens TaxID=6257 RepID=A0A915AAM9_PARUN